MEQYEQHEQHTHTYLQRQAHLMLGSGGVKEDSRGPAQLLQALLLDLCDACLPLTPESCCTAGCQSCNCQASGVCSASIHS